MRSNDDAVEIQQRWRTIQSSWNLDVAQQQFEGLCDRFANTYSSFIAELRKKSRRYLAVLHWGIRSEAERHSVVKPNSIPV
jgi:hypothetical protein